MVFFKLYSDDNSDLDPPVESSKLLNAFFNPDFDSPSLSPYMPIDKVREYCPCSGYEGDWELDQALSYSYPIQKARYVLCGKV